MLLFTIVSLPLAWFFQAYGMENKFRLSGSSLFAFFFGLAAGALFLSVLSFTTFIYHSAPFSFWQNWLYFFVSGSLVPICGCAFVFFLLFRGSIDSKLEQFPSVLYGFYAVFIPFAAVSRNFFPSNFYLFCKPLLVVSMIQYIRLLFPAVFRARGKSVVFYASAAFAALVMPAVVESLWFIGCAGWIWAALFLLYAAGYFFIP